MPHYLRRLVDDRAKDEAGLKARTSELLQTFRERRAGGVKHNGSEQRVIDGFGLVYAAGTLAKEFGELPDSFQCGPSAPACFLLHRDWHASGLTLAERINQLASHPDLVELGQSKRYTPTDAQLKNGIFKVSGRSGPEPLIRADRIEHFLPGWKDRNRSEAKALIIKDDGHTHVKRILVPGQTDRVFAFKLSE